VFSKKSQVFGQISKKVTDYIVESEEEDEPDGCLDRMIDDPILESRLASICVFFQKKCFLPFGAK